MKLEERRKLQTLKEEIRYCDPDLRCGPLIKGHFPHTMFVDVSSIMVH